MDPIPPRLQRLWDTWDIRVMILCSLGLQIILILFGGRRKYVNGIWIDIVIWPTYLMADWVASVSLGKLSDFTSTTSSTSNNDNNSVSPDNPVMALWAALFLLHLGGPDTITAFSVQDVQLWLRHALGLVIHVILVVYIFLRCWTASSGSLSAFNFLVFVAGVIKYSERTWALYSANSVFPRPFLPISPRKNKDKAVVLQEVGDVKDVNLFAASYRWLQNMSAPVFAGFQRVRRPSLLIPIDMYGQSKRESMFKFIELVLGFMYDAIYTKATRIYTMSGLILRAISFLCTVGMILVFWILPKHRYSDVNIWITYVLLVGAVVLEIYAFMLVICSEWMIVWMARFYKRRAVRRILQILVPLTVNNLRRRWSGSAQQMNLVSLLLYDLKNPMLVKITKLFRIDKEIKEYTCRTNVTVPQVLKEMMVEGVERTLDELGIEAPFTQRGELALKHQGISDQSVLLESIRRDFSESLMIWHVVTDYLYHQEINNIHESEPSRTEALRCTSKFISDYMMYLLVSHSYMLNIIPGKVEPLLEKGMEVVRQETSYFRQDEGKITKLLLKLVDEEHFDGLSQADEYRLQETTTTDSIIRGLIRSLLGRQVTPNKQWSHSKDMKYGRVDNPSSIAHRKRLYESTDVKLCLAGHLADTMVTGDQYKDSGKRWETINGVWMEMLFHAAAHCQVSHHLERLRRGGELLTHVWLLLTLYGLTDANRIVGGVLRQLAQQALKNPVNDSEASWENNNVSN